MKILFILLLLGLFVFKPVQAVKLFGVDLLSATKKPLNQAAINAGARLKNEAGELEFYDEYFSADILKGSDKLFIGFLKDNEKFAFAEYEFKGLNQKQMLQKLTMKYGQPEVIKQVFISDSIYRWNVGGIEVSYYQDWSAYKTRLTYAVPERLQILKLAKKKVDEAIVRGLLNKQINVY